MGEGVGSKRQTVPSLDIETKTPSAVDRMPSGACPAGIVQETARRAESTTEIVYGPPRTELVGEAFVFSVGDPVTLAVTGVSPFWKPESVNVFVGFTSPYRRV